MTRSSSGGRLGPAGAAERADRRGVRQRADRVEAQPRDDVRALAPSCTSGRRPARRRSRRTRRSRRATRSRRPVMRAVARQPQLGVLHLAAAVHREHRLAAGLGPLHRPAELAGRDGDRRVVGADAGLAAERAADVGRDDPDVLLRRAPMPSASRSRASAGAGSRPRPRCPVVGRAATRIALPSIGATAMRWLTIRTRTTWSASSSDVGGVLWRRRTVAMLEPIASNCSGASVGQRLLHVGDRRAGRRSRRRRARRRRPPAPGSRRSPGRPGRRRTAPCRRPGPRAGPAR